MTTSRILEFYAETSHPSNPYPPASLQHRICGPSIALKPSFVLLGSPGLVGLGWNRSIAPALHTYRSIQRFLNPRPQNCQTADPSEPSSPHVSTSALKKTFCQYLHCALTTHLAEGSAWNDKLWSKMSCKQNDKRECRHLQRDTAWAGHCLLQDPFHLHQIVRS